MKAEDIVGAVLLRVSGGRVSSDISVTPHDILTYVPDVINSVMGVRIHEDYGIDSSIYPNGLFLNTLEDIPVTVNSRNLAYIEFPQRPLSVVGGRSIVAIGVQGGKQFTRVRHDDGSLGSFYWKTRTDVTTFDIEGNTAVFYNLPVSVEEVFAKIVVHIDDIEMDDDIFVPSGMETAVIDLVFSKVVQQREIPSDTAIDGRDVQ